MTPPRAVINGKSRFLWSWRKERPDHRDFALPKLAGALPQQVDLRPVAPRIEDQDRLGSCVANSSTSAFEYLYRKSGKATIELSRLYVYYYTRALEGTSPRVDSGCYIRTAMKCLARYGAAKETLWPYIIKNYSKHPPVVSLRDGQRRRITTYYRCPSLLQIKTSLAEGFPVVGGFSVPQGIYDVSTSVTGVVKYPGAREAIIGGHAILFVGYDDEKRLLTFENSWGLGWGAGGFGFLPYAFVENGLADDFWTIRAGAI